MFIRLVMKVVFVYHVVLCFVYREKHEVNHQPMLHEVSICTPCIQRTLIELCV